MNDAYVTISHLPALVWRGPLPLNQVVGGAIIVAVIAGFVCARQFKLRPKSSVGLFLMRLVLIVSLATILAGPSELPVAPPIADKPTMRIYVDTSRSMLTQDVAGRSRIESVVNSWLAGEQINVLAEQFDIQLFGFDTAVVPLVMPVTGTESTPASPVATSSSAATDVDEHLHANAIAQGRRSHIVSLLRDAIVNGGHSLRDGDAVLLLSDGHDSNGDRLMRIASAAKGRRLPVHAVCFGGRALQQDLSLTASAGQPVLLINESGQLRGTVRAVGSDVARVSVSVKQGGQQVAHAIRFEESEGAKDGDRMRERIAEFQIPIKHDGPGIYDYTIAVTPLDGEVETANNTQHVFVEVTDEPIRVLLLEGQPYWDTKYLAQSLRGDARVALFQITQISSARQVRIGTRVPVGEQVVLPVRLEEWAKFDVVILGRSMERLLSSDQASQLAASVRDSGTHVVFSRGKAYGNSAQTNSSKESAELKGVNTDAGLKNKVGIELAKIESVVWGNRKVLNRAFRVTDEGRRSPAFSFRGAGVDVDADEAAKALKAFRVMPTVVRQGVSAIPWAYAVPFGTDTVVGDGSDADLEPAILFHRVGAGRVVTILGEGLWQWSQLPPTLKKFDGLYDTFWSNLVRGLALGDAFRPNEMVSLNVTGARGGDGGNMHLDDAIDITIATRLEPGDNYQPRVRVVHSSGESFHPKLIRLAGQRRWRARFWPKRIGVYTITADSSPLKPAQLIKHINVFDEDIERLDAAANATGMKQLALETGGLFMRPDEAASFPGQLARLRAGQVQTGEPIFVWDKAAVLAAILLWLGTEWLLRRKVGML